MKKALFVVFICSALSMGLQLYLSSRSYSLSVDNIEGSTVCHINDSVNCDNTLLSDYSHFIGFPISNWGFATNMVLLFLSLFLIIGWESPALIWLTLGLFSALSAGASLVMLGVSVFLLRLFCPFCMVLYGLSFIIAIFVFPQAKKYISIPMLRQARKLILLTFFSLLPISALVHLIFINMYDIKSTQKIVKNNLLDWVSAPTKNTPEKELLEKGPVGDKALITVTKFADFLCFHCRTVYYTLKKFKLAHPQARIEYFSFPLDQCKSERVSCVLTKAVYCAEKQNQGWNMHGIIFEHQKEFINLRNNEEALEKTKNFSQHLNIKWLEWSNCIASSSAEQVVKKQIKAGKDMNIKATPAFFVNGKKMNHRYFIRTLKAIKKQIAKQKNTY